jgi:hypothetical protein
MPPITTVTLTAATVMDTAAALMNDVAKSLYTYVKQIPYLNIALQELQEIYQLNDIPVTQTRSAVLNVTAGVSAIGFATAPTALPTDLIEPIELWERAEGVDPYTPMSKLNVLPLFLAGNAIPQFIYYVWQDNEIRVLPASQDNDIKMDYTKRLFTAITTSTDNIAVINAQTFLEYRTGGLLAEFVGENPTRAQALNNDAGLAIDRALGIGNKGKQNIMTRRLPFRAGYKRGSVR